MTDTDSDQFAQYHTLQTNVSFCGCFDDSHYSHDMTNENSAICLDTYNLFLWCSLWVIHMQI